MVLVPGLDIAYTLVFSRPSGFRGTTVRGTSLSSLVLPGRTVAVLPGGSSHAPGRPQNPVLVSRTVLRVALSAKRAKDKRAPRTRVVPGPPVTETLTSGTTAHEVGRHKTLLNPVAVSSQYPVRTSAQEDVVSQGVCGIK